MVEEDIPRTFPHLNDLFEEIQALSSSLREIMQAYQNLRPDIGYIQGMSYVAGMLLLHCGPPEECFKVFCNVLNFEVVTAFYTFNLTEINKTYKIFWKLMREYLPTFYKLLRDDNVSCNAFLFEWVLTLYTSSFEIEACTYLLDHIFFYGEIFILKAAIAVCTIIYQKSSHAIDKGEIDGLKLIKEARPLISKDAL